MTALTAAASRSHPAGELVIELGADLAEAGDGDQALPVGVVDAAPGRARGVLGDDPLEVAAGPGRLGREAWGGSGSCPGALSAGLLSFRAHGHVLAGMPAGGHPTDPLEVAAGPGRLGREAWGGSGSCPGALSAGLLSFRAHGHVLAGMPADS